MVRLPTRFEGPRRRRRIGVGNLKQQPVRQDPRRLRNPEHAPGDRLPIDGEPLKPPRAEREREELKLEQVLEKAILRLEMLRREQDALGPQNRLQLAHKHLT